MKVEKQPTFHRVIWTILICILVCLTTQLQAQDEDNRSGRLRKWTDTLNRQTIRAKLIAVQNGGLVTLSKKDGQRFNIDARRLSKSDQKFINKYLERLTPDVEPEESEASRMAQGGLGLAKANGWRSIHWHPTSQLIGKSDKPIFWFRVLGQLDGGM